MFKYELCSKYSASWKASARNLQSYSFPDYNAEATNERFAGMVRDGKLSKLCGPAMLFL